MTGSAGAGVNRLVHSTVTSLGIFSNTDSFSSFEKRTGGVHQRAAGFEGCDS